jgi:uncharacterized SAM-binding protein YcdF (DUF218 family)
LRSRRRLFAAALVFCCVAIIVALTRDQWLTALGDALVESQDAEKSDAILVLAGDNRGRRIVKACELARAGYAPVILVSGPMELYGVNEADLAIRYAVSQGCPERILNPLYTKALSTAEESMAIRDELKRRNVRSLLIVTSNYHTRRAGSIFRGTLPNISVRMIAAPDRYFEANTWWTTREGQKTFFLEASKTLAGWIGL